MIISPLALSVFELQARKCIEWVRALCALSYLMSCAPLFSITVVYNLRIAETTRRQAQRSVGPLRPSIFAVTAVESERKTYNDIHQHVDAGIATLFYAHGPWYVRADGAVGHVHNCYPVPTDLKAYTTQGDDVLFMGGYHWTTEQANITWSGILGIPTHRDTGLLGAEFGTGHVGVGMQLDGSYTYRDDGAAALMGATRYVRFLSRTACTQVGGLCAAYDLSLGNLVDVLVAHCNFWGQHQLEFGYDATFAFGAHITPSLQLFSDAADFIRSSFYLSYRYLFMIETHGSGVILGFSYGFDHRPCNFGLKYSATGWLGFGVNF